MPVFAFTDIEGSTGLWERHQQAMGPIIARHYAILQEGVEAFGGRIIKKTGDGVFVLFPDGEPGAPSAALGCALHWQRRFQGTPWPVIGELRVRMAFHRGEAEEMAGDYYGPTANRTARFMALGWGGQILVSEDLRRHAGLPTGAQWVDWGVHQVKDIPEAQHVFGLDHPDLRLREFPALKSLTGRPHNLPGSLSPFVGRERELQGIAALWDDPSRRLITLLGLGGMGKTRLAIQAGLDALGRFRHGVFRVDLGGSPGGPAFAEALAGALKLALYAHKGALEQVVAYLADKEILLILDSRGPLGAGSAALVAVLEACPGLRILACSRRRLDLRGESVLAVRGLDYPDRVGTGGIGSCGAARLFVGQVRGFQPAFEFKAADVAPFLQICRAVGGMPMGLELAAEAVRARSLKDVAALLEGSLEALSKEGVDGPPSHRSLASLFESQWEALEEPERAALAGLSVFSGPCTAEAALRVAQASAPTLGALADRCLLESPGPGRYALLPALRLFAGSKLAQRPGAEEAARDAHARHYVRLLEAREANLAGVGQSAAVAELRQEFADVRRAWDRAVEMGWVRELGRAARCVGLYTDMQGLAREWEPRLRAALALGEGPGTSEAAGLAPDEARRGQAGLLAGLANHLFSLDRTVEARECMERSLSLSRMAGHGAGAASALVRIAVFLGPEDERRIPALEEAAATYRTLGDANGEAWARRNLGHLLCRRGDAAAGRPMVEESLTVLRRVGNARETAWALYSLGQMDLEAGRDEEGLRRLHEARDIFLGLGDMATAGWTFHTLGQAAIRKGQWPRARAMMEESLKLFGHIRHVRGRGLALRGLCEIFAGQGDLGTAFAVVDRAVAESKAAGDSSGEAGALAQKGRLLASQGRFDDAVEAVSAAQEAYARAGSAQGQAVAQEVQACIRLKQGRPGPARGLLERACESFASAGLREGEARLCVRIGDLDALEARARGGEVWYQRSLKLSRLNKPGDYSLGGLLGVATVLLAQGRRLEALHLALLCGRFLDSDLMPASDPEFFADLAGRRDAVLEQASARLMRQVVDDARARMAPEDPRALLKVALERYGS